MARATGLPDFGLQAAIATQGSILLILQIYFLFE
jgi:hypothetical protein